MMTRVELRGLHVCRKTLRSGRRVEYHYAYRGGPLIWKTGLPDPPGSPGYVEAFSKVRDPKERNAGRFRALILEYQASADWKKLAPRTRKDYGKWIVEIDRKFGDAPLAAFRRPEICHVALKWRDRWNGRQAAYAWTVLVRIVSWAVGRKILAVNHLAGQESVYEADRSEIIWSDHDIEAFRAVAPGPVLDALVLATETGLRPGDLVRLSRGHVETTPRGRRIRLRTAKRKRTVAIPVTPVAAEIIDRAGGMLILANSHGRPWTADQLSKQVTTYRRKAGIHQELRLYDARGTACTRLLMSGASLQEIAVFMGWSVKTAAEMIETYAAMNPDVSDTILIRLEGAKS